MDLKNGYRSVQDKYDSGMTLDDLFISPDKNEDSKSVTAEGIGEVIITDNKGKEIKNEKPDHIKVVSNRTSDGKLVQLRPRSFKFSQDKAISSIADAYGLTDPAKNLKKLLKYDPDIHGPNKDAFISEVSELLVKVQNKEWDDHLASLLENKYDSTILATIDDARKIVESLNADEHLDRKNKNGKPLLSDYESNKAGELLYKIDLLKWAKKNIIKVEEVTNDEEDDIKSVDSDILLDVINTVPELYNDLMPLVDTNEVDKVTEVFDDAVSNFINYLQSQYNLVKGMSSVRTNPQSDTTRKFKEEYVKEAEKKEYESSIKGKIESIKSKFEDTYSKKYEQYQEGINSKIDDLKIKLAESKLNESSSGIGKVISKIKQNNLTKRIERLELRSDKSPFTGFYNIVTSAWNKGRDTISKFDAQVTKWITIAWLAIIGIQSVVEVVPHIGDMILGLFGFGGKRISGLTDEEKEMSIDEYSDYTEGQSTTGRTSEQISHDIHESIESDASYQKEVMNIEDDFSKTSGSKKWYGGERTDKELAKWRLKKANKVFKRMDDELSVQPEDQQSGETDEAYISRAFDAFNKAKQIKLSQNYKMAEDRAKAKDKQKEDISRRETERLQNILYSSADNQNLLRSEYGDRLGDRYYFMEYDTKIRRYKQNNPESTDADIIRDVFKNDSDLYNRYKNSAKLFKGKSSINIGTSVDKDGKRILDTYDLSTGSIVRYDYEGDKQGNELSRMEIKNEDDISEITRSIAKSGDEITTTTKVSKIGSIETTTRTPHQNVLTKGHLQTENNQLIYATQVNYENPETGAL